MPLRNAHITTGEIAAEYGVPIWLARRAVDSLGETIPRAGLYRLVPRSLLPKIEAVLIEAGYLRRQGEGQPCRV
jgi:hypothetical protein